FPKIALDLGDSEERGEAVLAGLGDQSRGVEIRLGVVGGQHKRRTTLARQNVAHHQCTSAVVALDEQLRFAEDSDVDAGGAPPCRIGAMQFVPLDDIAYPAAFLVIKPLFGSCELECGLRPRAMIAAEEHERVHLEEELQITNREQIDAL